MELLAFLSPRARRRAAAAVLTIGLVGCAAPVRQFQPAVSPDTLDDTRFLHYLPTAPVASLGEGCRAVLLLGEEPIPATFAERREQLIAAGALGDEADTTNPDRVLSFGALARMLRTQCGLPRGLNEFVWPRVGLGHERYALRACVADGLLPPRGVHEPVTGGQLLAAFSQAESYLERAKVMSAPHHPEH